MLEHTGVAVSGEAVAGITPLVGIHALHRACSELILRLLSFDNAQSQCGRIRRIHGALK